MGSFAQFLDLMMSTIEMCCRELYRDFLQKQGGARPIPLNMGPTTNSLGKADGTIHVWYIYLHLVDLYGKCRQIYTIHGSYGCVLPRYGLIPLRHHGFILYSEAERGDG